MKIALRSSAGFSLMGLMVVLLGGLSLFQMQEMSSKSDEVDKKWLPSVLALEDVQHSVTDLRLSMMRGLLVQDASQRTTNQLAIADGRKAMHKATKLYASNLATMKSAAALNG